MYRREADCRAATQGKNSLRQPRSKVPWSREACGSLVAITEATKNTGMKWQATGITRSITMNINTKRAKVLMPSSKSPINTTLSTNFLRKPCSMSDWRCGSQPSGPSIETTSSTTTVQISGPPTTGSRTTPCNSSSHLPACRASPSYGS